MGMSNPSMMSQRRNTKPLTILPSAHRMKNVEPKTRQGINNNCQIVRNGHPALYRLRSAPGGCHLEVKPLPSDSDFND